MHRILMTFLFITGGVLTPLVYAKEEPLKVFICAGQSNMVGKRNNVSELPDALQGIQKNLFFDGKAWGPLVPGKTEKAGFGPEISFAQEMSTSLKQPIGIIKHSVGGTNLAKKWDPTDSASLYHALLKKVNAAQKMKNIEIVGMIWMQGESDAKDQAMATQYAENLSAFVNAVRTDLQNPTLIFLTGRINSPTNKFKYTDEVRQAQESCSVAKYGYIDCDPLEKGKDNLHYTTKGTVEMGQIFANMMLTRINEK